MKVLSNIKFLTTLTINNIKTYGKPAGVEFNDPIENNSVYWYGHATTIINLEGKLILTDPVITNNLGYFKRQVKIPMNLRTLKFDYILLSHGHSDHIHFSSLMQINKDAKVIAPKGYKRFLTLLGFKNVFILNHGKVYDDGIIKVKSIEAKHDGRRYYLGKPTESHSFLIRGKYKSVFFAGDTAYTENFKGISCDIALMPVGCYKPDKFLAMHCSPLESYKMFEMMDCPIMLPIHYKTFILSLEDFNETFTSLTSIEDEKVAIAKIGQVVKF
ncbi:MBL fold metallo-hydrolase [Clostridium paridis]|uniref:MBL fold metallo-hydrolase n=1 Tax=Clostridium paridis TaxID=2803863 RepID=A0A937FEK0_9CLOT|nr:MBL fold metallo-hydrolase [Clostridium paridis]MBL4930528.1 MBL fold metallo-hydrolase [Clostridium paridis]